MKSKSGNSFQRLLSSKVTNNSAILVRIVVGLVFLSEGIQKFLFPALLGTGRFMRIGFSDPSFWANFTGTFEIICGAMILIGLLTRLAAIPLLIVMATAFVTTKIPILMHKGCWVMFHEYRTDFAMTVLLIFLLIYGGGNGSIDAGLVRKRR